MQLHLEDSPVKRYSLKRKIRQLEQKKSSVVRKYGSNTLPLIGTVESLQVGTPLSRELGMGGGIYFFWFCAGFVLVEVTIEIGLLQHVIVILKICFVTVAWDF
jgi:hypothetical protein